MTKANGNNKNGMQLGETHKMLMEYLGKEQEQFTQKVASFYREVEEQHGLEAGSLGSTHVITNSGTIKEAEKG